MVQKHKSIHVTLAGLVVLALALLPASSTLAGMPMPWAEGLIETNTYIIEKDGVIDGQVLQSLYGHRSADGSQHLKAVYELARRAMQVQGQDVVGRMNIEVVFDQQDFDLKSRLDNFSVGGSVGRVTYKRTGRSIHVESEGEAEGLARETKTWDFTYESQGALIDQATLIYYIRSVPLEDGKTFSVSTINPMREGVDRIRGMVRSPRAIGWGGQEVEVWPIETSTPDGVTTYYIRPDADHTLLRYTSAEGETYEMRPEEEE